MYTSGLSGLGCACAVLLFGQQLLKTAVRKRAAPGARGCAATALRLAPGGGCCVPAGGGRTYCCAPWPPPRLRCEPEARLQVAPNNPPPACPSPAPNRRAQHAHCGAHPTLSHLPAAAAVPQACRPTCVPEAVDMWPPLPLLIRLSPTWGLSYAAECPDPSCCPGPSRPLSPPVPPPSRCRGHLRIRLGPGPSQQQGLLAVLRRAAPCTTGSPRPSRPGRLADAPPAPCHHRPPPCVLLGPGCLPPTRTSFLVGSPCPSYPGALPSAPASPVPRHNTHPPTSHLHPPATYTHQPPTPISHLHQSTAQPRHTHSTSPPTDVHGGGDAQAAHQAGAQVRDDVAVQVGHHQHVELGGGCERG